jgi:hypothetical protein
MEIYRESDKWHLILEEKDITNHYTGMYWVICYNDNVIGESNL